MQIKEGPTAGSRGPQGEPAPCAYGGVPGAGCHSLCSVCRVLCSVCRVHPAVCRVLGAVCIGQGAGCSAPCTEGLRSSAAGKGRGDEGGGAAARPVGVASLQSSPRARVTEAQNESLVRKSGPPSSGKAGLCGQLERGRNPLRPQQRRRNLGRSALETKGDSN